MILIFLFLLSIFILYCLGVLINFHSYFLTTYGLITLSNYIFQTIFALLNRKKCENINLKNEHSRLIKKSTSVNIHVVGYRENEKYFEDCLISCKNIDYKGLNKIIICIDGNKAEDLYMVEIANKVFPLCYNIYLDKIPDTFKDKNDMINYLNEELEFCSSNVICVTQPHSGKRSVLYTSFYITKIFNVDLFMNTDSDTIIDKDCITHLVNRFYSEKNIGGVAGELTIFNTHNWLSKLSNVRYYLAFNIERACQSYFGVVQCISGPNGLYSTEIISEIIEDWLTQTFLGKVVSYGDDRHLSNQLLILGYKIVYTHLATATTETPNSYTRWVSQQTRWNLSWFRELGITMRIVHKHNLYLTWEISYQLLFPIFSIYTMYFTIYNRSWFSLFKILLAIFLLPLFRITFIELFFEKKFKPHLYLYCFYPLLYITTLLPLKFIALFSLTDVSWRTSDRKILVSKYIEGYFPLIFWSITIIIGLIYHFITRKD
jgi:hyaluronan synthase